MKTRSLMFAFDGEKAQIVIVTTCGQHFNFEISFAQAMVLLRKIADYVSSKY